MIFHILVNQVLPCHTIRDKQKLKARASKIQGQVVALKKMLDEPRECAAVLQQIAAIRGAVNGLMREVIKGYLTEHIVHQGDELNVKKIWMSFWRCWIHISNNLLTRL